MTKVKLILFAGLFLIINNCTNKTPTDTITENEYLVQSTLWYQRSAEMRAIYYQTFNIAKMVLDDKLVEGRLSKPAALIVDIDETMLDNSPFEVESIRTGKNYSKEFWMKWTVLEKAKPLPGAVDFMNHATEKGVEVFYISNRYEEELLETINNLIKYNFPNADSAHVFLRKEKSDKTDRRNFVAENYVVLMLVGDNLTDFTQEFANRGDDLGFDKVDDYKDQFGSTFFILPNPMYGEWVKAINGNSFDLTKEEKAKKRKEMLIGYE